MLPTPRRVLRQRRAIPADAGEAKGESEAEAADEGEAEGESEAVAADEGEAEGENETVAADGGEAESESEAEAADAAESGAESENEAVAAEAVEGGAEVAADESITPEEGLEALRGAVELFALNPKPENLPFPPLIAATRATDFGSALTASSSLEDIKAACKSLASKLDSLENLNVSQQGKRDKLVLMLKWPLVALLGAFAKELHAGEGGAAGGETGGGDCEALLARLLAMQMSGLIEHVPGSNQILELRDICRHIRRNDPQLWRAICGNDLQLADKALDHMTKGRSGSMAARGKLPDAVQRKVAEAVKTNWPLLFGNIEPGNFFDGRSRIGGGDKRAPHLKDFRLKEQFGNAIPPLPEHGGFQEGA